MGVQPNAQGMREPSFGTVVQAAVDAIVSADARGRITFFNPAAVRMFGYEPEEVLGKPVSILMPDRYREAHARGLERFLATGEGHIIGRGAAELEARRKDGTEIPIELSLADSLVDGEIHFTAVVRDVTRRVREREARARTESRLTEAQRLAHFGTWEWDMAADTVAWTDELYRIYGLDEGSFDPTFQGYLERVHADDRERVMAILQRAQDDQQPFSFEESIVRPDGEVRVLASTGEVLTDSSGRTVGMLGVCHDVTDTRRAEQARFRAEARRAEAEAAAERSRRLQEISDAGVAHRDFGGLLDDLTERIGGLIPEASAMLLERTRDEGFAVRPSPAGGDGRPAAPELLAERVVRDRAAIAEDADSEGRPRTLGFPLSPAAEAEVVLVVTRPRPAGLSEDEIHMVELAAERASLAIDRVRVYEREHRIAETLQRSLLPDRLPEVPGVDVAARYLPAAAGTHVGGDWYDCLPLEDGSVVVVVGDSVGHGIAAAGLVGKLRNAARAYAIEGHSAADVVGRLNRFLFDPTERPMATLLYAVYRPRDATVEVVSAGHPPPLLRRPDGTVDVLEVDAAQPVGAFSDTSFPSVTRELVPGSALVLYTDGLVERRDAPFEAGVARLEQAVAAEGTADAICERVIAQLVGGTRIADDVAVLVFRIP